MSVISLLDHGYIRLVDHMGDDLSIVRAARVSYDADWRTGDDAGKDEKLINYLIKHRHTSPLECVQFTFEIKAPIFVMRQWMRHRTWKYNEISARYAELPEEYYTPEIRDITKQSVANKQQRTDEQLPPEQAAFIRAAIYQHNKDAFAIYHMLIKNGCARELARGVLPVNTYTKVYATVDLHNLLHFINLRDHSHAQMEIQVYARAMLELIEPVVPLAIKAYINNKEEGHEPQQKKDSNHGDNHGGKRENGQDDLAPQLSPCGETAGAG